LLPESLLSYSVTCGALTPHLLTEADLPWLGVLLEEHERFVGRPERELTERLREPLGPGVAGARQRLAGHVLARLSRAARPFAAPPRRVRRVLFDEAGQGSGRDDALARAAAALKVRPEALLGALFADLPGERLVVPLPAGLGASELRLRANLLLVQGLVCRASSVTITLGTQAHHLVRLAKLRGLLCTVTPRHAGRGTQIVLSGPFALFRHTRVYGWALASLVPHLAWCRGFHLAAECEVGGQRLTLALDWGDPIFPAAEPKAYDSRIEEWFARDFRRAAPDWDVVREPEPVAALGRLVFPDFAIVDRHDPRRRFLVEIVGFWTPEYLARKLAGLRAARLDNLILCIDELRGCADGDVPAGAAVVRYRRRIDPAAVLACVAGGAGAAGEGRHAACSVGAA
jgi:hypothetical protein